LCDAGFLCNQAEKSRRQFHAPVRDFLEPEIGLEFSGKIGEIEAVDD
jgi:hypothetical protein